MRELYVKSASIVIARVGKSEITKVENNNDDNDSGMTLLKTALLVSSTLKGDHQPVVYVDHYMYGDYKDQLSSAGADENLLVFLIQGSGMDGYYVDMSYGLKKLSDADLKVYVSRIEELASIMKAGKPSDTEIVEWLVRCAEEPATRWEGAYELAMSHYMLEQQADENGPSDAVEVSEGQTAEPPEETEGNREVVILTSGFESEWPTKANFGKLLTTEQKYRLTTALINNETMVERDFSLLDLVRRWDDPRLVPYLLAQLELISKPGQGEQTSSYFTENLMTIVADKLGDDALKAMVKNFSGNDYEQAETYEDEQAPSEASEEVSETNPEREAAEEAAAVQRRNGELQYFVTLALSTVPKTPTPEPADPAISTEP